MFLYKETNVKQSLKLNTSSGKVLHKLINSGAKTKAELQKELNIDDYSLNNVLSELEKSGLINTSNEEKISFIDGSFMAFGVVILNDFVEINLCSAKSIIRERRIETSLLGRGETLISNLANTINDMAIGFEKKIVGIGIIVIGRIDEELGLAKNSYSVLDPNCKLAEAISFITGYDAVLGHNVRAVAESIVDENRQNFVYIKHSPGVGAAVACNGIILKGAHGYFAEIGHALLGDGNVMCRCGRKGCLETVVSDAVLLENYNKSGSYKCTSTKLLYDSYFFDAAAKKVIDDATASIVKAIDIMYMLFDPQYIILQEGMFSVPFIFNNICEGMKDINGRLRCQITQLENFDAIKSRAASRYAINRLFLKV